MMKYLAVGTTAAMLAANGAFAAVALTTNSANPATDAVDQFNLADDHVISPSSSPWPYNVSAYSDRGPGQVFTTPNTSSSFTLDSFSMKGGGTSGGDITSHTWTIRVSSVSGSTITPLTTVSGVDGSAVAANSTDWLTWTFSGDDVVTLAGNATYAVEVFSSASYFGFAGTSESNDAYPAGYAFTIDTVFPLGFHNWGYDRTFVAGLTAVPEPSAAAVLLLAGVASSVCFARRRN